VTGTVLTIAGGKGGVGKTTTSLNASIALQEAGHDTAVVDADLGMTNLGQRLGVEEEPYLHDVLAKEAPLTEAVTAGPSGLSVLAGDPELAAFAKTDPKLLQPAVEKLAEDHGVVVVDTGAGLSTEVVVAAAAADSLLAVTTADTLAAEDSGKTARLAAQVDADVAGAVVTRADITTDTEALGDAAGIDILGTIPENAAVVGDRPAVLTAPNSHVAESYRDLASALADRLGLVASEATVSH